jgi:uncharacterized glyoxalase superfamily protein PhnB
MKFGYTIIYVPELQSALAFYERAFGFQRRFVSPDEKYGELQTGETVLAFASNEMATILFDVPIEKKEPGKRPAGIEVVFTDADVPAAYARAVAAGAVALSEPKQMPWGQTVSYVRDLNGVIVEICTPM